MSAPPPLRDYQQLAVDYITENKRCGLFLEPALGKTAICLMAIDESWLPALVIAPKRVAEETWPDELELWRPDLSYSLAVGNAEQRAAALTIGADVTIVSRDNAMDAINRRDARRPKWRTVFYDESSGIKTSSSVRFKVTKHLSDRSDRLVLMTGTPAPNGLMDIWAQLKLIDGGAALGRTLTQYRDRYFNVAWRLTNGAVGEYRLKEGAEQQIYDRIDGAVLGMQQKYRLELPKLTQAKVSFELPAKARRLYEELSEELVIDIDDIFGMETFTAPTAAILSSKLSQIAAGAIYPDLDSERAGKAVQVHRERFDVLDSLLQAATTPVLVLYRFRFEAEWIKSRYKEARSVKERGVIKEWNQGKVPILYGHPASCGHGLNLQHGGSYAIWTTPTWDLEHWEQANKRLHRPGQKNPVTIQTILANGTVDAKVLDRCENKAIGQIRLKEAIESPL